MQDVNNRGNVRAEQKEGNGGSLNFLLSFLWKPKLLLKVKSI